MNLDLDIYLSGYVQKLYNVKVSEMEKESEVTLRTDWWSVWRCEHLASDEEDKHVFVYTNAVSYFSILVFQEGLSLADVLLEFNKELLYAFREVDGSIPTKIKAHTRMIKGNPRSLISVMNNIIFHAEVSLFELNRGYDQTKVRLNKTPWGGPNYIFPRDETERLLKEFPLTKDNNIISFKQPRSN